MQETKENKKQCRTRNNGAKLIVKHLNTSVAQHFNQIKIITTWNALPNEVVTSRTVNSFKNSLDKHWAENPQYVRVKGIDPVVIRFLSFFLIVFKNYYGVGNNV